MELYGKVKVELDWEQESDIVVSVLRKNYASIATDTLRLKERLDQLEEYQLGDYYNNLKVLRGMDHAMEFFVEWSEHKTWRNAWKRVVDLYEDPEFKPLDE